jgi:nucleoside-diphosphate-sugar epimerase
MRVLFIGGTGVISTACTRAALAEGYDVYHLNRGTRPERIPEGVITLRADARDRGQVRKALGKRDFDCVVNWVAFSPGHVRQDIELFASLTSHYIFISSASVYMKPPPHWLVTERMPVGNPYWEYSRDKIACEEVLMEAWRDSGFPATIVRPSHTYSDGWIPTPIGSRDFTIARRIVQGRKIISPGDGQSLWTITHSEDFARGFTGLLGAAHTAGEIFHITSDEARTWDAYYGIIANVLGKKPEIVHIPSEFVHDVSPELGQGLLGDKAYSMVFDNSKIREVVPGFQAKISFEDGIRRSVAWFEYSSDRKVVDERKNQEIEKVLGAWEKAKFKFLS